MRAKWVIVIVAVCVLVVMGGCDRDAPDRPRELPASELDKVEVTGSVDDDIVYLTVYNGSAWDITELIVAINVVLTSGATVEGRQYSLTTTYAPGYIESLTTEELSCPLGLGIDSLDEVSRWDWRVVTAYGIPHATRGK